MNKAVIESKYTIIMGVFFALLICWGILQAINHQRLTLSVRVLYYQKGIPMNNVVVQVISTKNEHVLKQKSTDEFGQVTFDLPSGHYLVRVASGYTGQVKVSLVDNMETEIRVLSQVN